MSGKIFRKFRSSYEANSKNRTHLSRNLTNFELDSIKQINKTLVEVRTYFNSSLQLLGYLFTMSDPTINTATSLQIMRQTYTDEVIKTVIPRNTYIRDAHFNKQDIFTFNPHSKSALAYEKLIQELFTI